MADERLKRFAGQLWLVAGALTASVVLSSVALLEFYAQNAHKLDGPIRAIRYGQHTVLIMAFVAALIKVCFRKLPLWRVILAAGLGTYTFYCYDEFATLRKTLPTFVEEWLPFLWVLLSLAVVVVALALLRQTAAVPVMLLLALAFATPPAVQIISTTKDRGASRSSSDAQYGGSDHFQISPNVYWIVLDGYPRQDVLRDDFGFDNRPFLNSLTSMGFAVLPQSLSNFPATINSVSSTLNMDYTISSDGDAVQPFSMTEMYPIVKGGSKTVARFKSAGYNYVHFENGYDYLTKCGEQEQRCIRGREGLDEQDVAILSNTPIIDLMRAIDAGNDKKPANDDSPVFDMGGVEDLTAKLRVIQETPNPLFLYAHIIAPHPPIRFRADCSMRSAAPDLTVWDAKARPDFAEQLKCVNSQAEALMRRIDASDPDAIIILQSDHGTAFDGQFAKKSNAWSDADLHERFGVLNAIRLPTSCNSTPSSDLTLIDTFPLVFACLTGRPFSRHAPRFFVTPYDNSAEFGQAVEYGVERVRSPP